MSTQNAQTPNPAPPEVKQAHAAVARLGGVATDLRRQHEAMRAQHHEAIDRANKEAAGRQKLHLAIIWYITETIQNRLYLAHWYERQQNGPYHYRYLIQVRANGTQHAYTTKEYVDPVDAIIAAYRARGPKKGQVAHTIVIDDPVESVEPPPFKRTHWPTDNPGCGVEVPFDYTAVVPAQIDAALRWFQETPTLRLLKDYNGWYGTAHYMSSNVRIRTVSWKVPERAVYNLYHHYHTGLRERPIAKNTAEKAPSNATGGPDGKVAAPGT